MSNENIDPKFFPTNKKRKRISFSKNLMLQELLSDGSTRIFEEKINDDENCSLVSMAIDDSDSIFNKTVYDTNEMELSLLSPKASPTPLSKYLNRSPILKDDADKQKGVETSPKNAPQQTPDLVFSPQALSLMTQSPSPSPSFSHKRATTPVSQAPVHKQSPTPVSPGPAPSPKQSPTPVSPGPAPSPKQSPTPVSPAPTSSAKQSPTPIAPSPSFSLAQSPTSVAPSQSLSLAQSPTPVSPGPAPSPKQSPTPVSPAPTSSAEQSLTPIAPSPSFSLAQSPTSVAPSQSLSLAQSPTPVSPGPAPSPKQSPTPIAPSPSFSLAQSPTSVAPSQSLSLAQSPTPVSPAPTSSAKQSPTPIAPSPSFSLAQSPTSVSPAPTSSAKRSTTPVSPSLSPSVMQQDIVDTFYDSVLVYVDEKSVLQLSCDDSTPEQSMIQYHQSTTFAADLLGDDSIEEDKEESANNTLNFIDNRAPSPVRKMLNSASIDSRLWSFISEINEEYALLTFLQGNFKVLIKFDLQEEDSLEVIINEISFQSLIDHNMKAKSWIRISDQVVHLLTKPRDAKLLKIIKNLAEARLDKLKQDISTPAMLNDVLKRLCKIFNRLEALTIELAELSLRHEWKIINADINSFEIALETYGLRYTLWLVLCLDLETYPDYPCKIKFGIHKADLKLYPYHLLNRAAKSISPGDSDYLRSIVRATKKFVYDYRRKHSRKSVRISFAMKRSIMCTNDK